jgi:hypothetical protein
MGPVESWHRPPERHISFIIVFFSHLALASPDSFPIVLLRKPPLFFSVALRAVQSFFGRSPRCEVILERHDGFMMVFTITRALPNDLQACQFHVSFMTLWALASHVVVALPGRLSRSLGPSFF